MIKKKFNRAVIFQSCIRFIKNKCYFPIFNCFHYFCQSITKIILKVYNIPVLPSYFTINISYFIIFLLLGFISIILLRFNFISLLPYKFQYVIIILSILYINYLFVYSITRLIFNFTMFNKLKKDLQLNKINLTDIVLYYIKNIVFIFFSFYIVYFTVLKFKLYFNGIGFYQIDSTILLNMLILLLISLVLYKSFNLNTITINYNNLSLTNLSLNVLIFLLFILSIIVLNLMFLPLLECAGPDSGTVNNDNPQPSTSKIPESKETSANPQPQPPTQPSTPQIRNNFPVGLNPKEIIDNKVLEEYFSKRMKLLGLSENTSKDNEGVVNNKGKGKEIVSDCDFKENFEINTDDLKNRLLERKSGVTQIFDAESNTKILIGDRSQLERSMATMDPFIKDKQNNYSLEDLRKIGEKLRIPKEDLNLILKKSEQNRTGLPENVNIKRNINSVEIDSVEKQSKMVKKNNPTSTPKPNPAPSNPTTTPPTASTSK